MQAQGRGDEQQPVVRHRPCAPPSWRLTVPLVTPRSVELTSSRLHGYEYNPLWGFLPAQASVR